LDAGIVLRFPSYFLAEPVELALGFNGVTSEASRVFATDLDLLPETDGCDPRSSLSSDEGPADFPSFSWEFICKVL
jgi:hypothetical protein